MPEGRRKTVRILVTSSKGGIGKSTVSVGLALALAEMGRRVLLADCDLGGRSLDLLLGEESDLLFDIGDVAHGRAAPSDAILSPWGIKNLGFCPSPAVCPIGDISGEALIRALRELEAECGAEYVICDTAGMVYAPELAAKYADTALVAATQQPASVRAAEATAMLLADRGLEDSRLIINCFEWKSAEKGSRTGILDIIDGAGIRCCGIVPYDRSLMLAGESGDPPREDSDGMIAFENIARRLEGENVRLFYGMSRISGKKAL